MTRASDAARRAGWLKQLHSWHWISSALCLVGMLLFAATGITLNHASSIEARPQIVTQQLQLPAELLAPVRAADAAADEKKPLPAALHAWIAPQLDRPLDAEVEAEWSADEIYLAQPRPGGDAWLRIDRRSGAIEYESTDRGWISYLNDLHKGRHTGAAWRWFIDLFAIACLVFCITGLLILKHHAAHRPSAWPLVGLGFVLPALLALLLIH
ncbi:MAG: PepSY-associated TM helix domain-containing protein [Roseateles sp.]